jgi:D-3-phosphoglycerate dehydrogenase
MMKSSTILINTARGPLIDEAALIAALTTGRIACAGLDVFLSEPLQADSPLRRLENVTLTDHAAWYSEESQVQLKTSAAKNVARVLSGEPPLSCVNPQVLKR